MIIIDDQCNVTAEGLATAKKIVNGKAGESLWFYALSYRQLLKSQNGACFHQFFFCVCACMLFVYVCVFDLDFR